MLLLYHNNQFWNCIINLQTKALKISCIVSVSCGRIDFYEQRMKCNQVQSFQYSQKSVEVVAFAAYVVSYVVVD